MKKLLMILIGAALAIGIATVSIAAAAGVSEVIQPGTDGNVMLDVELWLYGDVYVNGTVDVDDITQIKRFINGKSSVFGTLDTDSEEYRNLVADVTGNGVIDVDDITQIKRYINGKTSVFDAFSEE